jgi:AAA ATPase domain
MDKIYKRDSLARKMAQQLLQPGVLDEGLRSGLFLSGVRRTGKTTFLVHDLIPALEAAGAIVVYVDLWSDIKASPASLVQAQVRQTVKDLQAPTSALLAKLKRVSAADVGLGGFKFGFKLDQVGTEGGATLAQALAAVVDQAKRDVVVIIDEVQHAITTDDGQQMLLALKAARDAINTRPGTPGHFIFIGTGSHRALVSELTARRNQAFTGATSIDYPVLQEDYVAHVLQRLALEGVAPLPSLRVASRAFETLGSRPEELIRALRQVVALGSVKPVKSADVMLPIVAATLRSATADNELAKVEQMGPLASAIFEKVASTDGDVRGLFAADAVQDYAKTLGRDIRSDEVQSTVNDLLAANIIMRRGHGLYCITDPFVQTIWREKRKLKRGPAGG